MYKVRCLKAFGSWAKKGKILELSDHMTVWAERKGIVKIIRYLGKYPYSEYFLKQSIKSMEMQVVVLQLKIKAYEKILKNAKTKKKH